MNNESRPYTAYTFAVWTVTPDNDIDTAPLKRIVTVRKYNDKKNWSRIRATKEIYADPRFKGDIAKVQFLGMIKINNNDQEIK